MTIYIVLVIFFAAASVFEIVRFAVFAKSYAAKIINDILFAILTLALTFTAGFRLFTGHDYSETVLMFDRMIGKSITELAGVKYEKGYVLLNLLASYISVSAVSIFMSVAVLFSLLLFAGLKSLTSYPITGMLFIYLFGFYFNSLNFMRSMLGAAIVLNAFAFLRGPEKAPVIPEKSDFFNISGFTSGQHARSFLRYAALILAASVFHRSAIIMLPFWFILRIRINAVTLPIYIIAGGGIMLSVMPLIEHITKYVYSDYNVYYSNIVNGISVFYSVCEGVIFIIAFLWRKRFYESKWGTVLISASFFSFYFSFVSSRHAILGRFSLYFGLAAYSLLIPELIVLFAMIIAGGNDGSCQMLTPSAEPDRQATELSLSGDLKSSKSMGRAPLKIAAALSLICVIASGVLFFGYSLAKNYNGVVPHQWIWNYYG